MSLPDPARLLALADVQIDDLENGIAKAFREWRREEDFRAAVRPLLTAALRARAEANDGL